MPYGALLEGLRSCIKNERLQIIVSGLSKQVEGRPRRNGGRGGYLRRKLGKNGDHEFGRKTKATKAVLERQELRKSLVVWRRRWAKKQIKDSVGPLQKSSATQKRLIRRAVPAVCKGNIHKSKSRDRVRRGNTKIRTFVKKQQKRSDYNSGIKSRGARDLIRQRMWRISYRTARKTVRLEVDR
jgi:hypothetical protein